MKVIEKPKKDVQYVLHTFTPKNGKVKYYQKRAMELSKMVNKNPPWSWRYVQSVDHGTVKPSMKFEKAVQLLKDKPSVSKWVRRIKGKIAGMAKVTRQAVLVQK